MHSSATKKWKVHDGVQSRNATSFLLSPDCCLYLGSIRPHHPIFMRPIFLSSCTHTWICLSTHVYILGEDPRTRENTLFIVLSEIIWPHLTYILWPSFVLHIFKFYFSLDLNSLPFHVPYFHYPFFCWWKAKLFPFPRYSERTGNKYGSVAIIVEWVWSSLGMCLT